MQNLFLILLLAVMQGPGGSDVVGSLPAKYVKPETGFGCTGGQSAKVTPGNAHTNGDGVTVSNGVGSSGNATISPANGDATCATNVVTRTGFDGYVDGLDSNDSVSLGSSNTATVTGNGGTVALAGGSTVTVTNTGGPGSSAITVILPSANTATVPPGSSTTFKT